MDFTMGLGSNPLLSRTIRSVVRLLATALLVTEYAGGQTEATLDRAQQIDAIAVQELQRQNIPAMTIAVAMDGRVIYSRAFGSADLENGVVATPDTLIRTGSIAKSITASAAMALVDAGKLDLDAPIQKYCRLSRKRRGPSRPANCSRTPQGSGTTRAPRSKVHGTTNL